MNKKGNLKVVNSEAKNIITAVDDRILIIDNHNHRIDKIDSIIGVYSVNDVGAAAFKIWIGQIFYEYGYHNEKQAQTDYLKVLAIWHKYLKSL